MINTRDGVCRVSVVGVNIKAEREKQGYSQNALAKKAGIAQATLNAIERQTKNPTVDTVNLIAEALGVTTAKLLGEGADEAGYTIEEKKMIDMYRQLTDEGKAFVFKSLTMALISMKKSPEGEDSLLSASGD